MDVLKIIAWAALTSVALWVCLALLLFFVGCKTYEPVPWNDKLTPQCNMTLNTYKLYYSAGDKSATVPDAIYCYKSLHREECRKEVYGEKAVDYNDPVKYRNYTQCLAELK
jgi:hypothetical protein